MELTPNRKAELLAYCRIDEEDLSQAEKDLIESLYDSAVEYMTDAGISEPAEGSKRRARYDLCVNFMVLRDWDMREATFTGQAVDNPAFRRLVNQLKLTEPVSNLGTF